MGPLLAIGGVSVDHAVLGTVERQLDKLCESVGIPEGEEFKWSPGRELWMREHLTGNARTDFFRQALKVVSDSGGVATVIVTDTDSRPVTRAPNHSVDLARLYIERVEWELLACKCEGIVIVDRPSGGCEAENKFLRDFQETLTDGTSYVKPKLGFVHLVDGTREAGYRGLTPHLPERVSHGSPAERDCTRPAGVRGGLQ